MKDTYRLSEVGIESSQGGLCKTLVFGCIQDGQVFTSIARLGQPLERTISSLRELADRMERHLTEKKSEE